MSSNKGYQQNESEKALKAQTSVKQLLEGKNWAISLCGGGVRGVAHLGILQAFEEANLKVSALSGCSSGALVAALYAAGNSPQEILEIVLKTKWWKQAKLNWRFNGLLLTDSFVNPFLKYLPKTFEELQKPLYVNAMDLERGESLVFSQGELIPILKASSALPIICQPVQWQNKRLYDGGLMNNLPIEPLIGKYDKIVGVHTNYLGTYSDTSPKRIKGIRKTMERIFQLSIAQSAGNKKELCDVWLEPKEIGNFRVFDFKKVEQIYEIAYQYAKEKLEE